MNSIFQKYGYTLISSEEIPDARGTLYTAKHEKSGAGLNFLRRDDKNMTFAIAFRTPPKDDTGVFHIIEHSVLCGSRKFPVKEPFVELLKGSLNTFLNALTYEDRTVYPVSSRCEKDFLNLADVYLDAVFHPRMLSDENVFLQEGWHYEYDKATDTLSYNGVVYNEMCGAYSSPEEISENKLRAALFPDTVYCRDSGGDPDAIPTLTYSELKEAHSTYYHPSNSEIFLDGDIDLSKALPLINSYLDEYTDTKISTSFPLQAPVLSKTQTIPFEPSGDPLARVLFGYVYSSIETKNIDYAISVLDSTISQTNESALKKALLATGLCEDVITSVYRSRQTQYTIEVIGVKEEDTEKVAPALESIIRDIAKQGVDKERLGAVINNEEFRQKEFEGGSTPRGVTNALAAFSFLNFGFSAAKALTYSDDIEFARKMIDGDFYEKLLLSLTVDNPHRASVIMLPKEDYEASRAAEKKERLAKIRASLTDSELDAIVKKQKRLAELQTEPDSPEACATLPTLALSDITPSPRRRKTKITKTDGATVLTHGIDTGDITYLSLGFAADDLTDEELLRASILTSLLKNLGTEKRTALSLQNDIKANLGALSFSLSTFPITRGSGDCRLIFSVSASSLKRNKHKIPDLISEILFETRFTDTDVIEKTLIQIRSAMDEAITADSLGFAMTRVSSSITAQGRVSELTSGISAYRALIRLTRDVKASALELSKSLPALLASLITKERLTVSLASDSDSGLADTVLKFIPSRPEAEPKAKYRSAMPKAIRDGIVIPARVAYATVGAISDLARDHLGAFRVARSILSYEYLWNEVRVKGGAYGTGFIIRKTGELGFYSYRDPSPESSLAIYKSAPEFLRDIANSGDDLTKFIIGAYGEYDILTTPKIDNAQAIYDYYTRWSAEDEKRLLEGILSADKNSLLACADILDEAMKGCSVCVSADKATLSAFSEPLELVSPSKQ